jgi:ABC-type lipoprotein export system ATPase subunit
LTQITLAKNNLTLAKEHKEVKQHTKGRRAHYVVVIAGVSGCGKTQLIRNMSQPHQNEFTLSVLKQLDCDPNQHFQRSTLERMQRLMNPANAKNHTTRKSKNYHVLFINITSINHNQNLKRLRQISTRAKRLDAITLYTPHPKDGANAFSIDSTRKMSHRCEQH